MAACSLGTINVNIACGTRRDGILRLNGLRTWTGKRSLDYAGLRISGLSRRVLNVCTGPSVETLPVISPEDDSEEPKIPDLRSQLVPNFDEVEYLLTKICDTTSVAEFELKLSGFHLHVTRDLTGKDRTPPPPTPAITSDYTVVEAPQLNGSVPAPSLAITKPETSSKNVQILVDKAADEGLVIIQSPRVGFFRRSRTIKGKRAPPPCKEKQTVKEGQVVCYIEQLGGELPIESDVSGEVIKILREDGDSVGYNDALIAILPSFPGIKKLQ
ncbi:Lipoamide Acyltransferase [Parasponia andersonii]|uniref:Lipoamide Acyltransferase n=1 Tax=Parasponia andersonii TaxID=3476 RepID=A0A2P5BQ93_PARAD|nr:Lipoamide Acyltransferase [Parasponia andersonii]